MTVSDIQRRLSELGVYTGAELFPAPGISR